MYIEDGVCYEPDCNCEDKWRPDGRYKIICDAGSSNNDVVFDALPDVVFKQCRKCWGIYRP